MACVSHSSQSWKLLALIGRRCFACGMKLGASERMILKGYGMPELFSSGETDQLQRCRENWRYMEAAWSDLTEFTHEGRT
jgi:hypothetical protein